MFISYKKNSEKPSDKKCLNVFECQFSEDFFTKDGFVIRNCTLCKHRYTIPHLSLKSHIEKNYDNLYFFGGKTGYPNYLEEKDILIDHGIQYAKIINKIINPGKMLDVGCASGFIMKGFIKRGWKTRGIEPNEQISLYGKNELDLEITNSTLENYKTDEKFDLISLIQVIGHFYNIDKALINISDLLVKNGLVLVESWNMGSLYAKILGRYWHEYSPPTVLHWFSKKTLINIFKQYGFAPLKIGIPIKRISINHAFSLLEEKLSSNFAKDILRKTRKLKISQSQIIYPPLDIFWIIFKKIS